MIFDLDAELPSVPLSCPNCGSRKPTIRADKDKVDVLFGQCGAHEVWRYGSMVVEVLAECRVKPSKPALPRRQR